MTTQKEEERYRTFLKGTFLIKGWNQRAREILQAVDEKDRGEMEALLSALGEKIGREWAKDPGNRKIGIAMLQNWGKELKAASDKGPDLVAERVRRLDGEVDELLS
jgi:hypothetical protein